VVLDRVLDPLWAGSGECLINAWLVKDLWRRAIVGDDLKGCFTVIFEMSIVAAAAATAADPEDAEDRNLVGDEVVADERRLDESVTSGNEDEGAFEESGVAVPEGVVKDVEGRRCDDNGECVNEGLLDEGEAGIPSAVVNDGRREGEGFLPDDRRYK
jgi:hypothetical protein